MDDQSDHEAEGVGDDVALAAFHFLPRVKSADAAAFRGLYALAVDDARRWAGFPALQIAGGSNKMMIDRVQQPHVAPFVEIALYGRWWREALR